MSINKFQEKVFRTGCGSVLLIICAGVFFAGMFYVGCGMGGNSTGADQAKSKVAILIGDIPIYATDLSQQIDGMRRNAIAQGSGSPDDYPPAQEANNEASVITQALDRVGASFLAHRDGVKFTDDAIKKSEEKKIEEELFRQKFQLMQANLLKGDATDKQFDEVLKKQTGRTSAELKALFHSNLDKALKDNKLRPTLESEVAKDLLVEFNQAKINPSDAELKATYDSYQFKRIQFAAGAGADVSTQIAKAQADLKGGLTFEQAMDRYSKEPAQKGKHVSDNMTEMSPAQLDSPAFAPLKALKAGQVSDPIDEPMGKTIYKLVSVKNMAPPDLAKNRAKFLPMYTSGKAEAKVAKDLKDLESSKAVQWQSPGYKVLWDWNKASQGAMSGLNPAATAASMRSVADEGKKAATANQGYDARAALLAWYCGINSLWTAPGADKAKLSPERIEVTKAMISDTPYFSMKMELVDLLVDAKQAPEAVAMLQNAAESNVSYDSTGLRNFQDINAKLTALKTKSLVDAKSETAIRKAQDEWVKQNLEVENEKAQQKRDQAAAQKQLDAEKAKALADTAKEKAAKDAADKAAADKAAKDKPKTTPPAGGGKPATGNKTPMEPKTNPVTPATGKKP